MPKLFLLLLILFSLSCTSDRPVLFEINTEARFSIAPGLDNIRTHTWPLNGIRTNIAAIGEASNTDLIEGIFANRALIEAPFIDYDFRLVNEIQINIWKPGSPQDKLEVFFMDRRNNRNREQLELFSSLSEVKEILLNDTFDGEIKIRFAGFTPAEIDSRLTMNFVAHGAK